MFDSRYLLVLICTICLCFFNSAEADTINCNTTFASENNTLELEFDRDQVRIYRWNATEGVNILLPSVKVQFAGDSFNSEFGDVYPLTTSIEGVAYAGPNDTLQATDYEVSIAPKYGYANVSLQKELFDNARACINQGLSEQFTNFTEDDVSRAQGIPHDFGEKTIPYLELNKTYPNIGNAHLKALTKHLSLQKLLQSSLNEVIDFALTGLISAVTSEELGFVALPDLNQDLGAAWPAKRGYFNLTGGKIGDLTKAHRTEDVVISSEGLRYSINTAAQWPGAKVEFRKYALLYSIFNREGSGTVDVDRVALGMQIVVNYNVNPCTIKVGYIRGNAEGARLSLAGNGFGDTMLNGIANLVLKHTTKNIVSYLEKLLENLIAEPLSKADCEKFRPRLG